MSPQDEIDIKGEAWFNDFLPKLRYKQDYSICFGHSKNGENSIHISRPYVRLFATGVTKIYRMAVLGEQLEDVVYTPEEQKELDDYVGQSEKDHAKSKGEGWE